MIGPLNLPHSTHGGRGCHGTVRVRLGYLVSTHPGMGALNLKCSSSCGCRPIKSTFLRRVLPFPRLETNGRASGSPLQLVDANESVSITAYTIFIAKLPNVSSSSMHGGASSRAGSGARGCYVEVSHVRAHGVPRSSTSSRVRLDSLAIMEHDGMRGPTVPCAWLMLKYEYVYCRKYDHTGLYAVLPRCARAISQESLQRTTDNAETSTRYEQEKSTVCPFSRASFAP